MIEALKRAIEAYRSDYEDKSGTGPIDVLIAKLKNDNRLDDVARDLREVIRTFPMATPKSWRGVQLIIEKLDLKNQELMRDIQISISREHPIQNQDRFEQIRAFQLAGGILSPKLLSRETTLKEQLPEFWLDLAIDAFRGDEVGLTQAVGELINNAANPLTWKAIRRRIDKLSIAAGSGRVVSSLEQIANFFKSEDERYSLLRSIDERLGTSLSQKPKATHQSAAKVDERTRSKIKQTVDSSFETIMPKQKKWNLAMVLDEIAA